jgi:tRNA/tmRNA/rRNA uracil-C5-methylase (TrmA/RlmC/RlmD family)
MTTNGYVRLSWSISNNFTGMSFEDSGLLGYVASSLGKCFQKFRRNVSLSWTLRMKATLSFEESGTSDAATHFRRQESSTTKYSTGATEVQHKKIQAGLRKTLKLKKRMPPEQKSVSY